MEHITRNILARKILLLVFVCTIHPSICTGQIPPAQPNPQPQAEGVDFILLIDESGSMCGSRRHPGQNDPMNKRNTFLELVLKEISRTTVKGKRYRISLIEFGSRYGTTPQWKAQVTLSAFHVPERLEHENEAHYFDRLRNRLHKFNTDRNRGNSDHGEALRLAHLEIKKLDHTPLPVSIGQQGVSKRMKVIYMLSDGKPYVERENNTSIHETQLKREIKTFAAKFPKNEVILYVLGLNSSDNYWHIGEYGNYWDEIAGRTSDTYGNRGQAQFIKKHRDMYEQIMPILIPYTHNQKGNWVYGEKFDCPPYLDSIEIFLEFSKNFMKLEDVLFITQPNGTPLSVKHFQTRKTYATLRILEPMPGTWEFKRKPHIDIINIRIDRRQGKARLVSPLSPVHTGTNTRITFRIPVPSKRQPFTLKQGYPLEGMITITAPDGTHTPLNALLKAGGFTSSETVTFKNNGRYKIRFTADVVTSAGNKATVIDSGEKEITVARVDIHPVRVALEKPGAITTLFGSFDEKIKISFYTGKEKIPLHHLLPEAPGIQLEFQMIKGEQTLAQTRTIDLKPQQEALTADIEGNLTWHHFPSLLLGKISAKMTLKLDNRMLKKGFFLEEPGTLSNMIETQLDVGESLWIYVIILAILTVPAGLLYIYHSKKKERFDISREIPVLVYRHGIKVDRDETVTKELTILKKKMVFSGNLKTAFDVPDMIERWIPELTVIRHQVEKGVKITVKYERFNYNKMDKDLFEEVLMETRDNDRPFQHRIEGLPRMMFELRIKDKKKNADTED
ncbi:MAG: VWA domain-containing protein [bacterium]|nr:VWA domain-containing protein [bacterium]